MENPIENPIVHSQIESKIVHHNMILMVPSWSSVLGYHDLGEYKNKTVSKILSDPLIFLVGAETSFKKDGENFHCLFGLGYYHTKFETDKPGIMIEDKRTLTGLILSDFVYDHIAGSRQIALKEEPSITIAEKVISVPFKLRYDSEEQKSFINGLLMRNLFVPHKDSILSMLDAVKSDPDFEFQKTGHLLLCATREHFDEILVSERMIALRDQGYLDRTAGIGHIKSGADLLLTEFLSDGKITEIQDILVKLHEIFGALDVDPVYLISLIERAKPILNAELPEITPQIPPSSGLKAWILSSAVDRYQELLPWPPEFVRNVALESQIKEEQSRAPRSAQEIDVENYDLGNYKGSVQVAAPQYRITSTTNPKVQIRPLPKVPDGNEEELLHFVNMLVEEDYDMPTMAKGFDICRERLRRINMSADYVFELSQLSLRYAKEQFGLGLSPRDKDKVLQKTQLWYQREVDKRLEAERIERERLEAEQRERDRIEQERLAEERRKQEFLEQKRLEAERLEQERLERLRQEEERKRLDAEQKRLEAERLEQERLDAERKERERLEMERLREERLERERLEREGTVEYRLNLAQEKLTAAVQKQLAWKNQGTEIKNDIKSLKKLVKQLQKEQKKAQK